MASFTKDRAGRELIREIVELVKIKFKEQCQHLPDFSNSEYAQLSTQEREDIKAQVDEYNSILRQKLWEEFT